MSDTESFESVYERTYPRLHNPCSLWKASTIAEWLDDLERAHDREIRDTAQREYHRGYEAGRHSMDADHRAVAMRLRALRFDGGSHENLSSIAYAIYPCATGWTCESAAGLRDKLIDLMGGVSDGPADDCSGNTGGSDSGSDIHFDGVISYDELDAESTSDQSHGSSLMRQENEAGITDELREWARRCTVRDFVLTTYPEQHAVHGILEQSIAIADRIDERAKHDRESDRLRIEKLQRQRDEFKRAAERGADLIESMARDLDDTEIERDELQAKLDKANGENKGLRLSVDEQKESIAQRKKTIKKLMRDNEKLEKQRDELQSKLDEYDHTHVELPRDANGNVFRVGCTVRMVDRHPEVLLTVHSMTLCDDGVWRLYVWRDKDGYSCNLPSHEFEVCEKLQDTAESIVRELTLGTITESQAIDRIEALHAEP